MKVPIVKATDDITVSKLLKKSKSIENEEGRGILEALAAHAEICKCNPCQCDPTQGNECSCNPIEEGNATQNVPNKLTTEETDKLKDDTKTVKAPEESDEYKAKAKTSL